MPAQVLNAAKKQKRLARAKALLRCFSIPRSKRIFFTDEKALYVDPPVNRQNDRLWAAGRKKSMTADRLLNQRAKFSEHVMVSVGVCFGGKGRLQFVPDKTKINARYYTADLLLLLYCTSRHCSKFPKVYL